MKFGFLLRMDVSAQSLGGMALRRSGHADRESGSVGAPSGAGRMVPVRLKPHLPRIFEFIRMDEAQLVLIDAR